MKATCLLLPFLLLSLAATKPLSGAADQEHDPVLDVDGQKLRTGSEYYILPVFRGRGGGLTLTPPRNGSCPFNVAQEQQEVDRGLPLKFTPVNPKEGVIRVSTDHNVKFSAVTICIQSNVWRLAAKDEATGQRFIAADGVEGNPGRETLSNWFKIHKYDDDYKLVFCPTVCNTCRPVCGEVGIYIEDGVRKLALNDEPFKIMFKKAS